VWLRRKKYFDLRYGIHQLPPTGVVRLPRQAKTVAQSLATESLPNGHSLAEEVAERKRERNTTKKGQHGGGREEMRSTVEGFWDRFCSRRDSTGH
jgi:hypothetical protein